MGASSKHAIATGAFTSPGGIFSKLLSPELTQGRAKRPNFLLLPSSSSGSPKKECWP